MTPLVSRPPPGTGTSSTWCGRVCLSSSTFSVPDPIPCGGKGAASKLPGQVPGHFAPAFSVAGGWHHVFGLELAIPWGGAVQLAADKAVYNDADKQKLQ